MRIPTGKTGGGLASAVCFFVLSTILYCPYRSLQDFWWDAILDVVRFHFPRLLLMAIYMLGKGIGLLIPFIVAILVYHRIACRRRPDGHTRCGKCQYILKGLIEPRCPECGNVI